MRDNPLGACVLLTGVLSVWALMVFFLARFLLGLMAGFLSLDEVEVALVSAVLALAGAVAAASLVVIAEHGRSIVRSKRRI